MLAISLSDTAPTSPCRLLLLALVGLTTGRLDDNAPIPDFVEGCHDHLLRRKPHSPLESRIIRVLHIVTQDCNHAFVPEDVLYAGFGQQLQHGVPLKPLFQHQPTSSARSFNVHHHNRDIRRKDDSPVPAESCSEQVRVYVH
jgi:hypothetical protein